MTTLYPIWIGTQRFAIEQTALVGIDYLANVGSPMSHVHTQRGSMRLAYVHERLGESSSATATIIVLILRHHADLVGIAVDKLDDAVVYNQPFLPLPPLIRLHDSKLSILGVALLDSEPCLVIELASLIDQ